MRYRRNFTPGGSFFFTVITHQRRPMLAGDERIKVLREAFRRVRDKHHFTIDAIVILPDHLHTVWTLPPTDTNYPMRWGLIKSWFTKHSDLNPAPRKGRRGTEKGEKTLWQPRYWEHTLRDENDFARHIDYIHYNPVKHGYVNAPRDWPHSSFHKFVAEGIYPEDWGDEADTLIIAGDD